MNKDTRLLPSILPILILAIALPGTSPPETTAITHELLTEPGIIQPGASEASGGTLGFLFLALDETYPDGDPVIYATAAAHGCCTPDVGEILYLSNGGPAVGIIAEKQDNPGHDDWILVRVFDESREHVDFRARYWTGPTGIPVPDEIQLDDVVCHEGRGQPFWIHAETRARCYRLTSAYYSTPYGATAHNGVVAYFPYIIAGGDSGSPIIHYETGQALGMHLSMNPITQEARAIDVCSLLKRFADFGYNLELATAPYNPPPARPTAPAPWAQQAIHDLPDWTPLAKNWWKWETECMTGTAPT